MDDSRQEEAPSACVREGATEESCVASGKWPRSCGRSHQIRPDET